MMAQTEEKLDEIGGRSEHSPWKSLKPLAQKAQVSTRTAWTVAEKLCERPNEIIQGQAITREERVFVGST
jgi:hypothetical protein